MSNFFEILKTIWLGRSSPSPATEISKKGKKVSNGYIPLDVWYGMPEELRDYIVSSAEKKAMISYHSEEPPHSLWPNDSVTVSFGPVTGSSSTFDVKTGKRIGGAMGL
jgi:hypothetical protein